MSNNDGAAIAQCIAVGEELSRAMVEVAHLREENERLRAALERRQRPEAETIDGVIAWIKEDAKRLAKTRAALGEKE